MSEHTKYEIPTDPHDKLRYESAMKHVEHAKKAGKSSGEIHALFKRVMSFFPTDIDSIPKDEAHRKYREAAIAASKAETVAEKHEIFRQARQK